MKESPQIQLGLGAFFFNLWERETNPKDEDEEPIICIALSIINYKSLPILKLIAIIEWT